VGTVVTGLGMGLRSVNPKLGWGITGFGLAHVFLGAIDLIEHQPSNNEMGGISEAPQQ
jgi:hypothetical protein